MTQSSPQEPYAQDPGEQDPGEQDPGLPEDVEPPGGVADEPSAAGVDAELVRQLDERTADLQRLQAEYVNYKRRVERDREAVRLTATATVLTGLLGVLDDVDRARQHEQLTGGFKAVADSLERTLTGLGLERFGEPGEPFDPRVHEALMHELADDVDGPTARTVLQPGYRVLDRVLRPARVAVAEPNPAAAAAASAGAELGAPETAEPPDAEPPVADPPVAEQPVADPPDAPPDEPRDAEPSWRER